MSSMPPDVKRRLLEIRCKAKTGRLLTDEETRYFRECFIKWPEEYRAMEHEVFEATKPFGAI